MRECPNCGVDNSEPVENCRFCKQEMGQRTASGPSDATDCSGRDWHAEYLAADRVIMVIQTMIDHAFSADDDVPCDHVVERLYNLIAAIHPEGALPNPLSEYMAHADGQNSKLSQPDL